MASKPLQSFSPQDTFLRLPHPYLANYSLVPSLSQQHSLATGGPAKTQTEGGQNKEQHQAKQEYYLTLKPNVHQPFQPGGSVPPFPLHRTDLNFSCPRDPATAARPTESNNTAWGRARRCPATDVVWGYGGCPGGNDGSVVEPTRGADQPPSMAQLWLLVYALFTHRPQVEAFRLRLLGPGHALATRLLLRSLLAVPHPQSATLAGTGLPQSPAPGQDKEVLVLRASFWQGAGSPFGPRPAWIPSALSLSPSSFSDLSSAVAIDSLPPLPLVHTLTYGPLGSSDATARPVLHPVRPPKPVPGSVVYSRWIPHLAETFSMVALDVGCAEHVELFHRWQNDPRVSAGWNESGSLEHHSRYLQRLSDDPSQIPLLACWDGVPFAYFEVYWGAEDKLGAYYGGSSCKDFDRGRHSLVGEVKFRGPHRVTAWWGSLVHYLFLDEARTMRVVGEPKASNGTVLMYDLMAGFCMMGFAELPHKRSAMVGLSRERFFEICPLGDAGEGDGIAGENGGLRLVGGTGVGLVPKL